MVWVKQVKVFLILLNFEQQMLHLFQRVGDLAWAAGDSQARGFLIAASYAA